MRLPLEFLRIQGSGPGGLGRNPQHKKSLCRMSETDSHSTAASELDNLIAQQHLEDLWQTEVL